MFKEIGDERTFNGILNQITDNIQRGRLKAGGCASGRTNDGRDNGSVPTGST